MLRAPGWKMAPTEPPPQADLPARGQAQLPGLAEFQVQLGLLADPVRRESGPRAALQAFRASGVRRAWRPLAGGWAWPACR